jgi:hypothetical protein
MPSKRNNRKNNRKTGAGYLSPAEFFNPEARQPSSTAPAITSEPTLGWVRPPMTATSVMSPNIKRGGKRSTRKNSKRNSRKNRSSRRNERKDGGFAPAVMGSFVSNCHSAIVPLVLAGLYSVFGKPSQTAKAVSTHKSKGGASKRNNRKNRSSRKDSRKNE